MLGVLVLKVDDEAEVGGREQVGSKAIDVGIEQVEDALAAVLPAGLHDRVELAGLRGSGTLAGAALLDNVQGNPDEALGVVSR